MAATEPQAHGNGSTGMEPAARFQPYVPPSAELPELSVKAILLGSLFGILFGASTVYLALRAGLTVSASIPIAVLSIAVFKRIGKSTILENNIVQTLGSAGESIASGVVFTVPALIFLSGGAQYFQYVQILTLAAVGGLLGILFMIPLRRSLIVKEHGILPYPEGTACAEVLVVGEKGGNLARRVFHGVFVATGYWILMGVLKLWKPVPGLRSGPRAVYPNATLECNVTPEYLGVGYIIGPRIAAEMVSGGILSWLALIPLLSLYLPEARRLEDLHRLGFSDAWIQSHGVAEQIYRAYIRYIGAGAVACAGVMTLLKTMPTIVASFRDSMRDLRHGGGNSQVRTERDIPIPIVVLGALLLVGLIAVLPNLPGTFPGSLLLSLLVVVFGFFFVTVASRIVGIIGSSSSPISGMTIATLMGTCLVFVSIGWRGEIYQTGALMVGSVVCIAAANAGATSQDLKTGYLVGATPWKQQIGLIIGVLVSVLVIGQTVLALDQSLAHKGIEHAIGTERMPAPQAMLMSTMIKGLLSQELPWGPVLVGVFLAFVAQLAGAHALSWAVGAYLPLSTTAPIFIGGVVRWMVHRRSAAAGVDSDVGPGMLCATGLVAGGSLAGLLIALLEGFADTLAEKLALGGSYWDRLGYGGDAIGFAMFLVLGVFLARQALSKA
ncbi:MAG: oligopeptide transporter, OPT family [Myxococcales bacterium]|nr:oligopeptide transporter, OPT family [Myxococcota bacterium]MDW8282300.1 oligopeptide transporter, OPT family [Myxococcales bacterium]